MKQSNSAARPGLWEPSASQEPVGRVAACELHLATQQPTACPKASQQNGIGPASPLWDWASQMHTFWSLEFGAFAVTVNNLPLT